MRQVPTLRGSKLRKLAGVAALSATAFAGAVAPAQAAGPPQQIDKTVQMICTLDLGGFVLRNLQLNVNVNATVPSDVFLTDTVFIENSFAQIEIPPATADALVFTGGDTVEGVADLFNLALTNTDPANVNVTDPPVAYGPALVPPGVVTSLRVPAAGTLPAVGPIAASATAQVGDVIVARLTALETMLHVTNSADPTFEADLPFECVNRTGAGIDPNQNIVSEIPIVEEVIPDVIPDATSVDPTSIDEGTATTVTLAGDDLDATTGVTIGGNAATFTVNGDGTVTVNVPALTPGSYDIVVSGEDGPDTTPVSLTVNEVVVPDPVPNATAVAPANIDEGAATTVTLTGDDLEFTTGVTIDGAAATFTVDGDTVDVNVPALTPGSYDIVVSGASGADASPVVLTVDAVVGPDPVPNATAVDPANIPEGAATTVTLSGNDLAYVTGVTVDGDAADFTVNANGTVSVSVPALTPGSYAIVVSGTEGADATPVTLTVDEVVIPVVIPDATAVNPSAIDEDSATTVTLTGSDLNVVNSVTIGGNAATFTVNANGSVTVNVPALNPGSYAIVVSGPDGADATPVTLTVNEVVIPVVIPNATSVNPSTIAAGTARTVTLSGTDLGVVNSVNINGNAATFTNNANGTITLNVPALAAGSYPIVVSGPDGADATPVTLTVEQDTPPVGQAPTVTKLFPNKAIAYIGGITIVKGTNLDTTKSVKVGGKSAHFVRISKTQLLVVLPGLKKGTYDLQVTNANGTSAASAASKIRYISLW